MQILCDLTLYLVQAAYYNMRIMSSKGAVGFEHFYAAMYGTRWATLKAALLADKQHIAITNPHSGFVAGSSAHISDIHFGHVVASRHAHLARPTQGSSISICLTQPVY
jgi:hypothetical protein